MQNYILLAVALLGLLLLSNVEINVGGGSFNPTAPIEDVTDSLSEVTDTLEDVNRGL